MRSIPAKVACSPVPVPTFPRKTGAGPSSSTPDQDRPPYPDAVAHTLAKLMELSDAELVQLYDESAPSTQVGVAFYREELARRAADRSAAAMRNLSVISVAIAVAALIVAVATLIVTA
jgi:hypothetical protein